MSEIDDLILKIKSSKSISDAARNLSIDYKKVKELIKENNVDVSHFPGKDGRINLIGKTFGKLTVIDRAPNINNITVWKCLCSCGKVKDIRGGSLTSGGTKSCGCLKNETLHFMFEANIKYKDGKDASAMMVWKDYYNDADITFEEFKILSQLNCFYCGEPPSNTANSCKSDPRAAKARIEDSYFTYNGLDRIDNSKFHCKDNVLTCCYHCNFAKSDLSFEDFKNKLIEILNIRSGFYNKLFQEIKLPQLTLKYKDYLSPKSVAEKVSSISIGDKLGKLSVINIDGKDGKKVKCLCDCGEIKYVRFYDLLRGATRSCNGGMCRGKYSPYVSSARAVWQGRYHKEGLLFEEFFELSQMNCFYCGSNPGNCATNRFYSLEDKFYYNGLDRIIPSNGYILNNVIPCCIICNMIKSDFDLKEFDAWLNNVQKHWIEKL